VIEFLEPSSERTLATIDRDFYERLCREDYAIGVSCFDKDGKLNRYIAHFLGGKPWVMPYEEEPPGFLTKIGDYIHKINTYRKWHMFPEYVVEALEPSDSRPKLKGYWRIP